MPKYLVKTHISHGHAPAEKGENGFPVGDDHHRKYEPGSVIELTRKQAKEMPWAVEEIKEKEAGKLEEKESGKPTS